MPYKDPQVLKEYKRQWAIKNREANKELHNAKASAWHRSNYAKNKDKISARNKKWRDDNPDKVMARVKAWQAKNPDRHKANRKQSYTIRQRLIGGQALSKFYSKEIKKIYANCPPGYHVDHVIPLRGKRVSGLHIPINLQYLPAADNIKKSNEFDVITG